MTERGAYLDKLLKAEKVSVRKLARRLAELRAGTTLDPTDSRIEHVRRSLMRYLNPDGDKDRDVSDRVAAEIDLVLEVKKPRWPPKRLHKVRRLEQQVADFIERERAATEAAIEQEIEPNHPADEASS